MIIDAEVHFWKYGKNTGAPLIRNNKSLQKDHLPSGIALSLRRNQVDACLAAPAEPAEVETRFLSELALTHDLIRGVIGWIDLRDRQAADKINELAAYTAIRGYRLDATGAWAAPSAETMQALAQYPYSLDLEISASSHTDAMERWIREFPDQIFVLGNCGNPDAREAPSASWIAQIRQLAKNKNLYCKISGLFTLAGRASWKPADFYPFLDALFGAFGPQRLLYASDWPFLLTGGSYVQWKSLLEKYLEFFSETDRESFFGENARRVYRV
jgi:L-fuconolactonase